MNNPVIFAFTNPYIPHMKQHYLFYIFILLFISHFSFGQVSEDFDGLTQPSYGNYSYNGFDITNGLCNSTNTRSGNAVRLRNAATSLEYVGGDGNGKDGGVGDITFWYRSWDASPTAIYDVEVSVNGGAYSTIGSQINTSSTTYAQWTHTLNDSSDNIRVRISRVSGERLHIDDFDISDYGGTTPIITTSIASITGLDYTISAGPSAEQTFTIEGSNLTNDITLTAPTDFEISTTSSTGFGTSINLTQSSGTVSTTTIYTRLNSGLSINTYSGNIIATSTGATTQNISLDGEVSAVSTNCIDEDFVDFSDWTDSGTAIDSVLGHYGLAAPCRAFGSGDSLISSSVNNPTNLQFYQDASGGGNGQTASIDYRIGAGVWVSLGTFTVTTAGNTENFNLTNVSGVDLSLETDVTFRFNSSFNTWYLDDVLITCGASSCSHTVTSLLPASGPIGTTVTVTGTGFTGSTAATINAISATVNFVSATEIEVVIPAGAETADLEITESSCTVATEFIVITEDTTSCDGTYSVPVDWTDLMFAGIFDETSGSCHYIELFNPTNSSIDLSTYAIGFDQNDASATSIPSGTYNGGIQALSGTIGANSTYMILVTSASSDCASCTSLDIDLEFLSTSLGYNGHTTGAGGYDKLILIEDYGTSNTEIDMWSNGDTYNDGYIYARATTSTAPTTSYSTSDWSSSTTPDCFGFALETTATSPYVLGQSYDPPSCSTDAVLSVTGYEGYNEAGDTQELAYQWYVVVPGSATWTILSDSGVYSGSTSDTLTISDTSALNGCQYYCQVREDDATCYQASDAIKIDTTTIDITWNGTWSNGTGPTSSMNVTLNSDYDTTTNGDFSCCSLVLSDNVILDIDVDDSYISVENDLTVNNGAVINVENNSSLVMVYDYGNVTLNGTGIINVNKESTPYELYDYTYWSSPIVDETVGNALSGSYDDRIYYYNGANYYDADGDGFDDNGDDWVQVGATDVMDSGRGYAAMGSITGTFPQVQYATFSGEVNNGIITETVSINSSPSAADFDYNLVGNPYPSAIDADEFIMQNPTISGTLYFWTHVDDASASYPGPDAQNFHPDDYASYNLTGGVATASGSTSDGGSSNAPTGKIGSGQGFIVEANNSGTVTFNNSMRNVTHSNSQFFKSTSSIQTATVKDRVWINLTNPNGAFNQALVGFFDNATNGYDNCYDGVFLGGGTHVSLYSLIDGGAYNIQGKSAFRITDKISLGFDSRILEPLTISIFETEGILSEVPVYLIDNELEIVHDLKESDYIFEIAEIGTYNNRFEILFEEPVQQVVLNVDEIEENNPNIIVSNELEFISIQYVNDTENAISKVKAYDVLGRLLIDKITQENQLNINSTSIKQGTVLIFKIKLSNGKIFTQKFIKL